MGSIRIITCSTWLTITTAAVILFLATDVTHGGTCPEPVYNDTDYVDGSVKFTRVSPTSKYLFPQEPFQVYTKKAMRICRSLGLHVGSMKNVEDYWHVVRDIVEAKKLLKNYENVDIVLDLHLRRSGNPLASYVNVRTKEPLTFHMFKLNGGGYFVRC